MNSEPQIITKVYDFILYLVPQVAKFPRAQKFLLGGRLEMAGFDVLEIILEAYYSQSKLPLLNQANLKLEQIRYYVRLCKDLKLIDLHRYEVFSKKINEVGVQLGGWIKQQKGRA